MHPVIKLCLILSFFITDATKEVSDIRVTVFNATHVLIKWSLSGNSSIITYYLHNINTKKVINTTNNLYFYGIIDNSSYYNLSIFAIERNSLPSDIRTLEFVTGGNKEERREREREKEKMREKEIKERGEGEIESV